MRLTLTLISYPNPFFLTTDRLHLRRLEVARSATCDLTIMLGVIVSVDPH